MPDKLTVAERRSWYIMNSMAKDLAASKRALREAEAVWDAATGEQRASAIYCSLRGTLDHLEQYTAELERAIDDLAAAGFR